MGTSEKTEIVFHGCEVVVSPMGKSMCRLKSARLMSEEIDRVLDQPRPDLVTDLVMDLKNVTSITSAGLNELIQIQKRSRASGVVMRLKSLNENLMDVFRITRLERFFELDAVSEDFDSKVVGAEAEKREPVET